MQNKTNLVGRRFGRLVAVSMVEPINGSTRWNCLCDCGNSHNVYYSNLVNLSTISCGKCPMDDLTGKRFYSLLVIKRSVSKKNRSRWVCLCDCKKITIATGASLRSGHKKSCGCRYQLSLLPKNATVLCDSLWGTYKSLAKKRGFEFSLSHEEFAQITKLNCFYCGAEPYQILKPRRSNQLEYIYTGVDRVDNTKGYTMSNVVPCYGMCNAFKSAHSQEKFIEHCKKITDYFNSKRQAEMTCPAAIVASNN